LGLGRRCLVDLEHDVLVERFLNLRLKLHDRKLQQADRLLQLRRHRELLAQSQLKRRFQHGFDLKREGLSEVDFAHATVGQNLVRRAARHQLSVVQDIGIAADSKCLPNIVIGYQYSNSALAQVPDDPLYVEHRYRVDAGKRLVEQNELGFGREGARDFHAPALTSGQTHAEAVADVADVQLFHQFLQKSLPSGPVEILAHLQDRTNIIGYRQLAENRSLLGQIT